MHSVHIADKISLLWSCNKLRRSDVQLEVYEMHLNRKLKYFEVFHETRVKDKNCCEQEIILDKAVWEKINNKKE